MKKLIMAAILACAVMQLVAMQDNEVDISGLSKIEVLQALFKRAKPQGMGFMHYNKNQTLSAEEAKDIIEKQRGYADYVGGRVMKVDVSRDTLNTWGFNRDNGAGAAEEVIQKLRAAQGDVCK